LHSLVGECGAFATGFADFNALAKWQMHLPFAIMHLPFALALKSAKPLHSPLPIIRQQKKRERKEKGDNLV